MSAARTTEVRLEVLGMENVAPRVTANTYGWTANEELECPTDERDPSWVIIGDDPRQVKPPKASSSH
jgi:hypothetical protein